MPQVRGAVGLYIAVILFLNCCACQGLATSQQQDFAAITSGVGTIQLSTWYGSRQILYGQAFAIAVDGDKLPMVSATRHGTGRVVFFPQMGMIRERPGNILKLLQNSARWASGKNASISVAGADEEMAGHAASIARTLPVFRSVGMVPPANLTTAKPNVYLVNAESDAVATYAAQIRAYIHLGGGLLAGGQAWYWAYSNPLQRFPGNILLNPLGIYITSDVAAADYTFTSTPPPQLGNADVALASLIATYSANASSPYYTRNSRDVDAAREALRRSLELVPLSAAIWTKVQKVASSGPAIRTDTPTARDSMPGLAAFMRTMLYARLPPEQLPAAPDAQHFPGMPVAGTQPLGNVTVQVNGTTRSRYWQGLGLYAAPGARVTVSVPAALLAAAGEQGITLQIGSHTDKLWGSTEWYRLPELVRTYRVGPGTTTSTTTIASALGGLIFVVLPAGLNAGMQSVTVKGAIRAARYVHNVTTDAQWVSSMRSSPAPWGELATGRVVINVPRAAMMTLDKPSVTMSYWDRVLASHAWLADRPMINPHPERLMHDIGTAIHNGYPAVVPLENAYSTLVFNLTGDGDHWAQFHEWGHNAQDDQWTWNCTDEVSTNWFSLLAEYSIRKNTNPDNFYGAFHADYTYRYTARRDYFAAGPSYDVLCREHFIHLDMFIHLLDLGSFGFQLMRDTIRSYRNLTDAQKPRTDDAKLQTWVIQQSRVARYNFGPYYKHWGWPVSSATMNALAMLPTFIYNGTRSPSPIRSPSPSATRPSPSPSPRPPAVPSPRPSPSPSPRRPSALPTSVPAASPSPKLIPAPSPQPSPSPAAAPAASPSPKPMPSSPGASPPSPAPPANSPPAASSPSPQPQG